MGLLQIDITASQTTKHDFGSIGSSITLSTFSVVPARRELESFVFNLELIYAIVITLTSSHCTSTLFPCPIVRL